MKQSRRSALQTRFVAGWLVVAAMMAAMAIAQSRPDETGPKVATVGGLDIRKPDLDERFRTTSREYQRRAGKELTAEFSQTLRRVALETLIRERLLMLEAERRGITVSDAEAEAEFRGDPYFHDKGVFSPARLEAVKTNSPKAYADAVRLIKRRLGGRKLHARLQTELRPEEARVRADAERAVKTASVSVLALNAADFSGALPEPREAEVIAQCRRISEKDRGRSFADIAAEVRRALREDIRRNHEEREIRAMYDARRSDYKVKAVRLRYAALDTARMTVPEPTAEELDVFYRSHMADFTSYDAATASVRVRPLAEVQDVIRPRWKRDQRQRIVKDWAERLSDTWHRNRRDRRLEGMATLVRDVGPVPVGALVDTGLAGVAVSRLLGSSQSLGGGSFDYPRGTIVLHVYQEVENHTPTYDEARALLRAERARQREEEEERGARALYDRDPKRFAIGDVLSFSRLEFSTPDPLEVPLTRNEVERYFQTHLDRFSSPERVRVRHILVSPAGPGDEADAAARARAEELRRRLRAGEDFAELARATSEDEATRDKGGDLGYFQRGAMLDAFERAAFLLKPGEMSDPVKTEVGYHIIRCEDYLPIYVEPLDHIYPTVGTEAAREKGDRMARALAESLYLAVKTPEAVKAGAVKLAKRGAVLRTYRHQRGTTASYPEHMRPAMVRLEALSPGVLYPGVETFRGIGSTIMWVDSISPPRAPQWVEARERAVDAYRAEQGRHALESKRAELDSLFASGWSLDSLGALMGGIRSEEIAAGKGLPNVGGEAVLDSLLFDGQRAAALEEGATSGWIDLPRGPARIRLDRWTIPTATVMAGHLEATRSAAFQRALFDYHEQLKRRFAVQILDPTLKGVPLPRIQDSMAP